MTESKLPSIDPLGLSPENLRRHAKGTFWAGIIAVILGILAIALPGIFTLGVEILVGSLLLVAGLAQVFAAFGSIGSKNWWLALLTGVLATVIGILFLINPFKGAAALTALLGIFFLVSGMFRLFYCIQLKGVPGTGFGIFNAIVTLILGILVLAGWPSSSVYVIGILLGIDLLFLGFFLINFGNACKKLGRANGA